MTSTTVSTPAHLQMTASPWVRRWSHLLSPQSSVLDIACGQGRHMQWFCSRGHKVTGIDRSDSALAEASAWGQTVQADIEHAPWPLMDGDRPRQFGSVVVTNYLWRPLLELVRQSIAPGGVLIYETFAAGNESVGKPSRPDFLLQPGELLRAFDGLRTVAYEDGFLEAPSRYIQRLVAVRAPASSAPDTQPPRYLL